VTAYYRTALYSPRSRRLTRVRATVSGACGTTGRAAAQTQSPSTPGAPNSRTATASSHYPPPGITERGGPGKGVAQKRGRSTIPAPEPSATTTHARNGARGGARWPMSMCKKNRGPRLCASRQSGYLHQSLTATILVMVCRRGVIVRHTAPWASASFRGRRPSGARARTWEQPRRDSRGTLGLSGVWNNHPGRPGLDKQLRACRPDPAQRRHHQPPALAK